MWKTELQLHCIEYSYSIQFIRSFLSPSIIEGPWSATGWLAQFSIDYKQFKRNMVFETTSRFLIWRCTYSTVRIIRHHSKYIAKLNKCIDMIIWRLMTENSSWEIVHGLQTSKNLTMHSLVARPSILSRSLTNIYIPPESRTASVNPGILCVDRGATKNNSSCAAAAAAAAAAGAISPATCAMWFRRRVTHVADTCACCCWCWKPSLYTIRIYSCVGRPSIPRGDRGSLSPRLNNLTAHT